MTAIELGLEDCWGEDGTFPQVNGHVDRREFLRALKRLAHAEGWDVDATGTVQVQHAYAIQDPYAGEDYRWWQLSPDNPAGPTFPITIADLDGGRITCQVAPIPGPPCPECGHRQEPGDDQAHDHCPLCEHTWGEWRPHWNGAPTMQLRLCADCGMLDERDGLADRLIAKDVHH